MKLFEELKRRNVFRVAGVYAVVGWLLAQAAVVLETAIGLPKWFDGFVVAFLLIGFPVAMILAWAFEMTPEGMKLTANVPEGESIAPKTGRRLDYAILAGVGLVAALFIYDRLTPEKPAAATQATPADVAAAAPAPPEEDVTETTPVPPPAASIAVLPFADLSPGKDQEYFSDGMAEEILNVLAKVDGLTVASRTSSFAFKGQDTLGIPAIADELNVRHILEGSVRKAGETIRVTAQLIDGDTDAHLWSETFDRPLTAENVFAIQDEIASAVASAFSSRLEGGVAIAPQTEDLGAYDLFLKARALFQSRSRLDEADRLLEQALAADPGYAEAWELRAALTPPMAYYGYSPLSLEEAGRRAIAHADKALALNPESALALAVKAKVRSDAATDHRKPQDFSAILADFDRALAIDPRNTTALAWRGVTRCALGDLAGALEDFAACTEIDPLYGICSSNAAAVLGGLGRDDEALTVLREGLEKGRFVWIWGVLARRGERLAFLAMMNDPDRFQGWPRLGELYDAFRDPGPQHRALAEDALAFSRDSPSRNQATASLLVPLGLFENVADVTDMWDRSHRPYRNSDGFRSFMRDTGIYEYWRKHGFPPQCKPVGKDDFECE